MAPFARLGCRNSNRNDIVHINLGFFTVLKPVNSSNKKQLTGIT
jgi:hypothetical protein